MKCSNYSTGPPDGQNFSGGLIPFKSMGNEIFIRVNGIAEESVVDGPGLRYVIFTQGCPHHCPGCHNPDTHDFSGGRLVSAGEIMAGYAENPLLAGITLSGGEPFMQPESLATVADFVRSRGGSVFTYTGFTFEKLLLKAADCPYTARLLELTDFLVDGPYLEELRDLELLFRGSSNQRLLSRADRAVILSRLA